MKSTLKPIEIRGFFLELSAMNMKNPPKKKKKKNVKTSLTFTIKGVC
jgi:hypothetical protein